MSRTSSGFRTVLIAVLLTMVVPTAGVVASPATVNRFTQTTSLGDPIPVFDDCRGIPGTLVGTDVLDYQVVETDQGLHFEGTDSSSDLLFSFDDGSYATGGFRDRFSFNAGPNVQSMFTNAHVDTATFYSADGVLLYSWTFRLTEHFVVSGDAIRVEFHRVVVDTTPCGR
jgi:hypothetical protein